MQIDRSLKDYLEDVSSYSPAPGGGSVVAYMTSLSIGLYLMSVRISVRRKSFLSLDEEIKDQVYKNIEKLDEINKIILNYVDKDIDTFNEFMEAYRSKDEEAIKRETIKCFNEPYHVLNLIFEAIDVMLLDQKYIVKSVRSDLRIALNSLEAQFDNCKENIDINIRNIDDEFIHENVRIAYKKMDEYREKLKDFFASV